MIHKQRRMRGNEAAEGPNNQTLVWTQTQRRRGVSSNPLAARGRLCLRKGHRKQETSGSKRDQEVIGVDPRWPGLCYAPVKHRGINQSIDPVPSPSIGAGASVKSGVSHHHWLLVQKRRHERRCVELVRRYPDSPLLPVLVVLARRRINWAGWSG